MNNKQIGLMCLVAFGVAVILNGGCGTKRTPSNDNADEEAGAGRNPAAASTGAPPATPAGKARGSVSSAVTIQYAPGAPFAVSETLKPQHENATPASAVNDPVEATALVQDFEGDITLNPYPKTGKLEFSDDWKYDGKRSVKIYAGTFYAFEYLKVKDWSPYQLLRIHTFVPGDTGIGVSLEIADHGSGYLNRHQNAASAPPGESVIDVDISGNLWRGEVNKPYRGSVKTPIDKRAIRRLAIGATGGDLYIDCIELIKLKKIATGGAFAFDFYKKGQLVQSQFIGITGDSVYSPDTGYGFNVAGAWGLGKSTPYPTPMMGNGLDFKGRTFSIDLPGGQYIAWVVFERSGFWGEEQSYYTKADLFMNGKRVCTDTQPIDAPFFTFQDWEVLDQAGVVKMVMARQGAKDFTFDAIKGRNVFSYKTDNHMFPNLRIAGLVLAPDTAAGRAFVDTYKATQRAGIVATHRLIKKTNTIKNPPNMDEPIVVTPLPTDSMMYPTDRPSVSRSRPVTPMDAFAGMTVVRLIGLYGDKPYRITASATALTRPGATISTDRVSLMVNRYMPMRNYSLNACWAETLYYRPFDTVELSNTVSRAVLLSVDVPGDATPGTYTGVITIEAENIAAKKKELTVTIPITLVVHPGDLPRIDFPNSLFNSGIPVPRKIIGDADYWRLSASLFARMSAAGKNFLTAGPNFTIRWEGKTAIMNGDDAVKMIRLAERYDMARVLTNYGGFGIPLRRIAERNGLTKQQVADALYAAWKTFKAKNKLPDYLYSSYDEPGTDAEMAPLRVSLPLLRQAGFKTIGYTSMSDPDTADANHLFLAKATTNPAFNIHSPKTLAYVRKLGNTPWVYNNGLDRYHQGVYLWRNHRYGAGGRCDWITAIIQGYQFDTLDSREPDKSCFYLHKKYGMLPSPRFMGVIEGGLDARLLFELERRIKARPDMKSAAAIRALFKEIDALPYRTPAMDWPALESMRRRMIALLEESNG